VNRDALARIIDHSVLKPEATEADIRAGAELVRAWRIGYYCVQPCWVRTAAAALAGSDARVVAVAGFPHGCDRGEVKAHAAALAAGEGAAEIDMVMNFGALKSGHATVVAAEIEAVVRAVPALPVKVILETAALADDDKRLACRLAQDAGAAFVKTSTGFHPAGGATVADVRLLREAVGPAFGVKASGGIRTLEDALAMIAAGASRIGVSASAAILGNLPG
jgi:deoxyribose-phosphate aldolase